MLFSLPGTFFPLIPSPNDQPTPPHPSGPSREDGSPSWEPLLWALTVPCTPPVPLCSLNTVSASSRSGSSPALVCPGPSTSSASLHSWVTILPPRPLQDRHSLRPPQCHRPQRVSGNHSLQCWCPGEGHLRLGTGSPGSLSGQPREPFTRPQSWHSLWKWTLGTLILTQARQQCSAAAPATLFLLVGVGASGNLARSSLASAQS